jgi:O-6-methylguanine DNA methyltransferase
MVNVADVDRELFAEFGSTTDELLGAYALGWYLDFRRDPATASVDAEAGLETVGYQCLKNGAVPAGVLLLEENAREHPGSAPAQFGLGRAYRAAGREPEAVAAGIAAEPIPRDPGAAAAVPPDARLPGRHLPADPGGPAGAPAGDHVATAPFFPSLAIAASGGFQGSRLTDWLSWPSRFWSLGPSLAFTVLDFGGRRANRERAVAAYDETVGTYRQTVLTAFQEVEDSLAAQRLLAEEFSEAELTQEAMPEIRKAILEFLSGPANLARAPLDIRGTVFQRRVWEELRRIPRGETRTYQDIARAVGAPAAVRAVGSACGANPVALVVPCHRAVRTDGGMGGYAWGLARKKKLLALEKKK